VFHLGEPMEGDDANANCLTSGEAAAELVAGMPRLEELYLLAHGVDMERLFVSKNLTHLRILQIYHNYHYPLEILAANPTFKNLTHLLLFPHGLEPNDDGAYITLDGVRALVHSRHLRSLAHLRLRNSDLGDEGCEEIARSGILKRLKTLDLKFGRIGDLGAEALAACPDIRNLELLDVSNNRLTEAGITALQRVCGASAVKHESQYDPDSDDLEYLWQGDCE
jgi:Leucine Rich repeat